MRLSAVIPAKSRSERVPDKNFRPFFRGLSLVELKILSLKSAGLRNIILSSNDHRASGIAAAQEVQYQERPDRLCQAEVDLGELFAFCLAELQDDLVYWAHPTSPFVSATSIGAALAFAMRGSQQCTIGVQKMHDFFWTNERPLNYDEARQPRSQDLSPYFRVTGGIHIAQGRDFCVAGAVSFRPHAFYELDLVESIDIDTLEEWEFAEQVAVRVLKNPRL